MWYAQVKHVGMQGGNKVLEFQTANESGDVVCEGRATAPQDVTSYVFTGQGSAEVGMGMELCV